MVKIMLNSEIKKDCNNGTYTFFLGNDTYYEFNSKADAKEFLTQTSKFITLKWFSLSLLTNVLDNQKARIRQEMIKDFELYQKTTLSAHCIEEALKYIHNRASGVNARIFIFQKFQFICNEMKSFLINLRLINVQHSRASAIYEINGLIQIINSIESEIKNYGLDNCTKFQNTYIGEILELEA